MNIRTLTWILFGPLLSLLLHGHCFGSNVGYDVWQAPSGQPEQMWSQVRYDRKLKDTFFESDTWSYPYWIWRNTDGTFTDIRLIDKNRAEDPPRLRHTSRCFSTSFGVKHVINFCEARASDGYEVELLIHETSPAFRDSLRVRIRDGKFTCQYWIVDHVGAFTWTTTRQELILDRNAYGKGDVIKGRIDFECAMKVIDPKDIERWGKDPSTTVKVFGVFRTVVE
jgi:hypothetical protein